MTLSEKSLNSIQYKSLLVLDLFSYGSALSILNQYVDDDQIKVFEISPTGSAATLILWIRDVMTANVLKKDIESQFKASLHSVSLIENLNEELLPTYLSQKQGPLFKKMLVAESNSLANSFLVADGSLKENYSLVDFRVVRTHPKNVILIFSADDFKINFIETLQEKDFHLTQIDHLSATLKSYFEII